MNPLTPRKQMLIAASDLNRARLVQDWQILAGEVHALAGEARTIRSVVSAAASLVTGLATLRRKRTEPAEKPAWWQSLLKGGQTISALWSEFRPRPR
jgi:uncharacterized protein (UPF0261 family)